VIRSHHLAFKVDRCDAAAAEHRIDMLAIGDRRWRGMQILRASFLGFLLEDFGVSKSLSAAAVNGNHVTGRAFVSC